jgi:hypothetical protein
MTSVSMHATGRYDFLARSVGFTAVTMKIAVFWDIKTRTSQETHYASATEPSRLMVRKI